MAENRDGTPPSSEQPDTTISSSLPAYPELNAAFVPLTIDADEIHFRIGPWSGPTFEVTDEDGDGLLADIVAALDGQTATETLIERYGPDNEDSVRGLLSALQGAGVVREHCEDGQLRDISLVDPALDGSSAAAIERSTVAVVTAGEIGQMVVEDLGRLGVDTISLADFGTDAASVSGDEVETLQRVTDPDLPTVLPDHDLVVCAFDEPRPYLTEQVNKICVDQEIPWTIAQINGFDGLVGPTFDPPHTCCYACFRRRREATVSERDSVRSYEKQAADQGSPTPVGARRVLAGWLAMDLPYLLANGQGFTTGSVLHLDLFEQTIDVDPVWKLPRCPVCGPADEPDRQQIVQLHQLTGFDE